MSQALLGQRAANGAARRSHAPIRRTGRRALSVVARDYPQPALETAGTFIEAQELSKRLASGFPRPDKPLTVAVIGAGLAGLSSGNARFHRAGW